MLTLILIALALVAVYSGGMWLTTFVLMRMRPPRGEATRQVIELFTFHLGICFILAIGFAGLILARAS